MLELKNVCRNFGGLQALTDVTMSIPQGQVTGLIGPNGAGKTTLINCMSGLDHPNSGTITLAGHGIQRTPPHRITEQGMARTYQNIRLFTEMTVLENVIVAQHSNGRATLFHSLFHLPGQYRETKEHRELALKLLRRFNLLEQKDEKSGNLSYGDQRRLEMARALATNPYLILLDEPTAGMNPVETQELGEQILRMRKDGLTLLVVEHDMALISQVCDAVYVLNFGQIIAFGTTDEIKQNEDVIEAYLGRED